MEIAVLADNNVYNLSEELGTASEDILAIGPAGPTARQIRLCQRLNAEMSFQDNGVIRAILTEEGLEKYANEDSILFQKIKGKKKKKKNDYLEKFLEDMEKFLKEIRQTFIHTLAVSAYRREVKDNLLQMLEELGTAEKMVMAQHVERYKGELDEIKQQIYKYREELKSEPSAQRVKEIQKKLHDSTAHMEEMGGRFKARLETLPSLQAPKAKSEMNSASGAFRWGSEAGGGYTASTEKTGGKPAEKRRSHWAAAAGGEAGPLPS